MLNEPFSAGLAIHNLLSMDIQGPWNASSQQNTQRTIEPAGARMRDQIGNGFQIHGSPTRKQTSQPHVTIR
jgi:hypothetical protein